MLGTFTKGFLLIYILFLAFLYLFPCITFIFIFFPWQM